MNSHLQLYRCTTLARLYFVSICESRSGSKLAEHFLRNNAQGVLILLMPMCPFLNACCLVRVCFLGFVQSSSSSSVSCSHLSPTASNSNPPYRKMANFHKASNAKLMFIGLKTFLTNQDQPYTSAPEMA